MGARASWAADAVVDHDEQGAGELLLAAEVLAPLCRVDPVVFVLEDVHLVALQGARTVLLYVDTWRYSICGVEAWVVVLVEDIVCVFLSISRV